MRIKKVEDIVRAGLCCGCGLCESIAGKEAIEMRMDREEFPVPHVRKPHGKDSEILACCPGISLKRTARVKHPLWGPITMLAEGYSTDAELRFRCSSGGAISGLLIDLLKRKRADRIIQVGVSRDNPLAVEVYNHCDEKIVRHCIGSRYQPSSPLAEIGSILQQQTPGATIAVVGKPCDIAGLRRYWTQTPELQKYHLILISFACAGMPSQAATLKLLEEMEVKPEAVTEFRYRGAGWPGNVMAQCEDGRCVERSYRESWGKILGGMINFRCKVCPDGLGDSADLVFGDAWRTPNGYPDFTNRDGISLCIARTALGETLLKEAAASGALEYSPIAEKELELMQPYHFLKKVLFAARYCALSCFFTGKYPNFREYVYLRRYIGWRGFPKNFIGTFKRYKKTVK